MGWLFNRRKPLGTAPGPTRLESGVHRSPGFAAVCAYLAARRDVTLLDLGPTSTENLRFLSAYAARVEVADLFRSCGGAYAARAEPFRFPAGDAIPLPEGGGFDVVLAWDLFHYIEHAEMAAFTARLAALVRPGALLLMIASAAEPVPPTPMQFKILDAERLDYLVHTELRHPAPVLTPRVVEKNLSGWTPSRLFQLRNGLQELLFSRAAEPAPAAEEA